MPSSTLFVLLRQHDFPHYVPGDRRVSIIMSCNFFSCLLTSKAWQWWEKLARCALTALNPCVCPSLLLSSGMGRGCSKRGLTSFFSPSSLGCFLVPVKAWLILWLEPSWRQGQAMKALPRFMQGSQNPKQEPQGSSSPSCGTAQEGADKPPQPRGGKGWGGTHHAPQHPASPTVESMRSHLEHIPGTTDRESFAGNEWVTQASR